MPSTEPAPDRKALNSWKEIAAYLGVTIRSAQRWEQTDGLPVRRGPGQKARVYSSTDEIDAWLAAGGAAQVSAIQEDDRLARRPLIRILALVVVCFGCALVGLAFFRARSSSYPVRWELNGIELATFDAAGRLCWKKSFPSLDLRREREMAQIVDLDGDQRPEVLFNHQPTDDTGSLMCFSADGKLLWKFRYGAPKTFQGRSFEVDYHGRFIRPVRLSGRPYVVTAAVHAVWFPAQIALIDAATGALVEDYWHPGAFYDCRLRDLDRDGVPEVVFAALNNPGDGLGHAALGVLKLPFSKAARNSTPQVDDLPPLAGGGEQAYILFPQPDVNRIMGVLPIPTLDITPSQIHLTTPLAEESGGIVYSFDFSLNQLDSRPSDDFGPLHERFRLRNLVDHSLAAAELDRLRLVKRFSGAPDGNHPTLNRF